MKDLTSTLLVGTVILSLAAPSASAQKSEEELPDRPDLPASADTNNAINYYNWGVENLTKRPNEAADAFYWASRLDPQPALYLYARRIALLMNMPPTRIIGYMEGRGSITRSDEVRAIDSLEMRALMREPVFYRRHDRELTMAYFEHYVQRQLGYAVNPNEVRYWLETTMRQDPSAPDEWNAWLSYNDRRLDDALEYYGRALRRSKDKASIYIQRGHIFALAFRNDSALTSLQEALGILREEEEDDEELVRIYQSKALLEFTMAVILENAGDIEGAREAHGRALLEDLSFYPAHLHMGSIALAVGDTAQAIAEFELAAELEPTEVAPYLALSVALRDGGQAERAAEMAEHAIEIEPYYAVPYLLHGSLLEWLGDGPRALQRYREYVERTTLDDPRRAWAEERIAIIEESIRGNS